MTKNILTIKEVAKYLKVTERTLYRLVQEGKIPAFKVGGSWRFQSDDIEEWIASQKKFNKQTENSPKCEEIKKNAQSGYEDEN